MVFDAAPVTAALSVPAQTQQSQPPSGYPNGKVSAVPGSMPSDSLPSKITLWAQNLRNDLMHGTESTDIGRLYKSIGGQPLANGEGEGVANFIGSPILGPLRNVQGQSELLQSGKRWQGVKDTVGGLLDTATVPSLIVSPGVSELAVDGGDALLTQAGRAAKAAQTPFSVKALQPKLQGAITSAIQDAAAEHGVGIPEGTSLRDVTQTLSDSLRAKAHGIYQQLDNALGGTRFQTWDDQLGNIQRAIRDSLGIDPEKDAALSERLADVTAARNAAMDDIRAKGLDPDDLIGQADATHRKAMALGDVSKAVRASTDVHPSQLADGASNVSSTNVRTKPLFNRMQQLATRNPKYPGTPSRLVQALSEQRAAELLNAVDTAHLAAQKIAARNAWIGKAAKAVGAGGLAYEAVSGLHHLLGASE